MTYKSKSVRYNFLMNFILNASGFIFPLLTFPYISRVLLVEGVGRVEFASSVSSYFLLVASLGIPTYGIRACAQVKDDKERLSKTVHEILIINSVTTSLVVLAYIVCVLTVPRFSEDKALFFIHSLGILLNMLGVNWFYQAIENYDYITVRTILFKTLSLVLIFLFVRASGDYMIYAAISVFALVGSNLLNFYKLRSYISFKRQAGYEFKKHLAPIFILFAQSLAISVYTSLDIIMLGFNKGDYDVGLYSAASRFKGLLVSLVTSLGGVLLPRMSRYAKDKMQREFERTSVMAINFTLLLSIPLTVFFVFSASDCLLLLSGSEFLAASTAMRIITVAAIPCGLSGFLGIQVLTSLEKEKYVLYSVTVGAVVDFALNCFMIPLWGANGAALATAIAEFFVLGIQLIYTKDIIRPIIRKIRIFHYLIFTAISSGALLLCSPLPLNNTFLRLGAYAIAFFGAYALCLVLRKEPILADPEQRPVIDGAQKTNDKPQKGGKK